MMLYLYLTLSFFNKGAYRGGGKKKHKKLVKTFAKRINIMITCKKKIS